MTQPKKRIRPLWNTSRGNRSGRTKRNTHVEQWAEQLATKLRALELTPDNGDLEPVVVLYRR